MNEQLYKDKLVPVSLQYEYDTDIHIVSSNIDTDEGCKFISHNILENCNDIKINNYSCLFLTSGKSFKDTVDSLSNKEIDFTNSTTTYNDISGSVKGVEGELHNNSLINIQYTTIKDNKFPCNIVSLKNQKTYTGYNATGNYWSTPNTSHTQSLLTGTIQEGGNSNIYLVNEFYMKDIEIQPGDNEILTPDNLYPFKTLDINDTTFIKNGAFGAHTPIISDRIYTDRYPTHKNNTILLCTWLSGNSEGDGIWLDRYYNPLMWDQAKLPFIKSDSIVSDVLEAESYMRQYGFFDKQSDLKISPNMKLIYHRITNDDINSYISKLNTINVNSIAFKNEYRYTSCVSDYLQLSGNLYGEAHPTHTLTNSFAISFDVDVFDWNSLSFYELFSSQSNNCGIRLYKKNNITPILLAYKLNYGASTTSILLYNTLFELIDEIEIPDYAVDVRIDESFQHLVVLYTNKVCIYSTFGALLYQIDDVHASIDVTGERLYVACNNIINVYDINSFKLITKIPTYANDISGYKLLICENKRVFYSNIKTKYAYIPSVGVIYISTDGILKLSYDNLSDYDVASGNSIKSLMNEELDTVFIHIKDPVRTEITETGYIRNIDVPTHPILDFTLYDNQIYFVTKSTLFISDIDRSFINKHKLPLLSNGKSATSVSVVVTNELTYSKIIVILKSDTDQNYAEAYQFKDGNFTLLNKIHNTQYTNFNNLTYKNRVTSSTTNTFFEIAFKHHSGAVEKYEKDIGNIISGKHTVLINIDAINDLYTIYIDDKKHQIDIHNMQQRSEILNYLTTVDTTSSTFIMPVDVASNSHYEPTIYDNIREYILIHDNYDGNLWVYDEVTGVCELYTGNNNPPVSVTNKLHTYNVLQNLVLFGNTLLYNGGDLATYTRQPNYLLNGIGVGNLWVYDTILTPDDIRINSLKNKLIPNIILNLPCGERCEVTQVKSTYKQTIPGHKSTYFDVIIKNLQLSEDNKIKLSNAIKTYIDRYLPITSTLNNITFKNY